MYTIPALLDRAAETHGQRQALGMKRGYRTVRWPYSYLRDISLRVAALVQECGLEKGDRVLLCAPNSPEWVAAYFGCLKAGAILVPLDVRSAPDFAHKVASQTTPRLAFVSTATEHALGGLHLPTLKLENLADHVAGEGAAPRDVRLAPDDVAEVMFTSGTTGQPKGVILTHGNITSNVLSAARAVPIKPHYRLLSLLPLSHMLEQTVGLLAPLSGGASVFYAQSRQPAAVLRAMREQRITTVLLVPQALKLFMDAIESRAREQGKERVWQTLQRLSPRLPMRMRRTVFGRVHRELGGALEFFICGGAYLDPALARKWEAIGVPVLQGYGATEASPIITSNSFRRRKLESVGAPVAGVDVRIDEGGEVLVRGPNITQGYWQDPQATAAAFNRGWYRTGDLGAFDRDGFLLFRGRKKDMIVLSSGLNVYAEDVEAALKRQAGVADAAVVGLAPAGQEVEVHAVLLLREGAGSPQSIVDAANASLAEHQRVRGHTVWPDADFPRTHTLKVKKQAVSERVMDLRAGRRPVAPASTAQPVSPFACLVARHTEVEPERVTGGARLGADLGLDSLARVGLLAALETEMGVYLDESQVSSETTVSELEALASGASATAKAYRYPEWPLGLPARLGRAAAHALMVAPLLRLFAPLKVEGRERLAGTEGPVIFAVNHQSHADTPAVLAALPARWRGRTAVAAAADFWFSGRSARAALASFLFNAFPFSRGGAVRPSLERCAHLLDRGWSVLIYPEGTRSATGEPGPFKSGTGLMAVEMGVPVVPVWVSGTKALLPKNGALPRRSRVSVRFGVPLRFHQGASYIEANAAIERAVRAAAHPVDGVPLPGGAPNQRQLV